MDLKCKRVNHRIRNYSDIDHHIRGFFCDDGVHLSAVGNDMYLLTDALSTFYDNPQENIVTLIGQSIGKIIDLLWWKILCN